MTATLAQAREVLADALTAVDGLTVRPRPTVKVPRAGDGWVTVGRMAPVDYASSSATLVVVIVLGADPVEAERLLELYAASVLDVATQTDELPAWDVVLEPITLVVESGAPLHAFTLTLTTTIEAE